MRVYFDIWTATLWTNSTGTVLSPIGLKRGDALPFYVTFLRNETPRPLAAPFTITFGIKLNIGDVGFLAVAEEFEWVPNVDSYRAVLNLNTQEIIDAMVDLDRIECFAELSYTDAVNGPISSQTIPTTIYREVVTGDEGTPVILPDADDWLTARAVRFDISQTLTSGQKTQAQTNIGLGAPAVNLAATIHAATSKTTPVDADELPLVDSAAAFGLKKLTWANIKATLLTYFTTLFTTRANNLSDLTSASTARTNLGLGTLATQSGTFSGTSSGTNTGDQDLSGLVVKDNNLSDLVSASTARTNLGLSTLATITPGTGVATAIAAALDGTGGLASKTYADGVVTYASVSNALLNHRSIELTGNSNLSIAMLGNLVELAGFNLGIGFIEDSDHGFVVIVGPGTIYDGGEDVTYTLAAHQFALASFAYGGVSVGVMPLPKSITPYNAGVFNGELALDFVNGDYQYGYMAGDTLFGAPSGGAEGSFLDISIQWVQGSFTLDFSGIKMNADALAALPITLEAWKCYLIQLVFIGGGWTLLDIKGPNTESVD